MIETLMGLQVTNAELYARYRAEMTPLLEAHGGSFGIDLWVREVLRSPRTEPFNRVFTIRFPSQEKRDAFFSSAPYLAVRKAFFEPSVSAISEFGQLVSAVAPRTAPAPGGSD